MRWIAHITTPKKMHLEIEPEEYCTVGLNDWHTEYKLYVYDGNGENTHDYLQETLEIAMDQAEEEFGVPKNVWRKVNE